ncbi:hypothetical protein DRV74_23800 [Salmonella enterica subsp. enterica serovar Senftenberg]|nr:hypothetical protein [Salmonella enterica subsp. enterica serovar Senftenberg]EBY5150082.1 hypothetical protein [Salmonella enterica subsp. enterica serovar Gloucester]
MHEYARKCIARKFTPFSRGKSCFRCSSYPKTVNGDAIYCVAVRRCRHSRKTRFQHVQEGGRCTNGSGNGSEVIRYLLCSLSVVFL